jgi:hypothetical protein
MEADGTIGVQRIEVSSLSAERNAAWNSILSAAQDQGDFW